MNKYQKYSRAVRIHKRREKYVGCILIIDWNKVTIAEKQ